MTPDGTAAQQVEPPASSGDSAVQDAAALVSAFASAVTSRSSVADAHVAEAFTLGWQMAEMYQLLDATDSRGSSDGHLPGVSELTATERNRLGLTEIDAGLAKLGAAITSSGLALPASTALSSDIGTAAGDVAKREVVRKFHVQVLTILMAADFRFGKAYGLGRALSDTCLTPTNLDSTRVALAHYTVENLRSWLDDLKSVLPPHAGGAVSHSLGEWSAWSQGQATSIPVDQTLARLRDQGRLWRSLLSGEKAATDMLTADDYINAAGVLLRETGALARRFIRKHPFFVALVILLFGGGIALMLDLKTTASIAAGLSGVIASIGLGWKAIGSSLGKALGNAERPLWGAALDDRVTFAITALPGQPAKATVRDRGPATIGRART